MELIPIDIPVGLVNIITSFTCAYSTVTIVVDGVYCLIFTDEKYDFI